MASTSNTTAHAAPKAAGHTATSNGALAGDNPIKFSIDLLTIQIVVILMLTRVLFVFLKPLRQPRVIAEVIGGVLLGPSALGRWTAFQENIFPKSSINNLETVAGIGLIFFLFLVGLELDLRSLQKTGKTALIIALAGISFPFVAGIGASFVLRYTIADDGADFGPFLVFMGVAMSITAFPVLARILGERKLLTTDVGGMAMSAAAVNDIVAWVLLALAVALSTKGKSPVVAVYVLLLGACFILIMFFIVKPGVQWIAQHSPDNEPINESFVAIMLVGVMVAAFATDVIGIHGIFGAFILGLIVPKDREFAGALIEKIEDFVSTLLLPLYFASSGIKTNIIKAFSDPATIGCLFLVIAVACIGKVAGTFIVSYFYAKLDARKSLTLGFLMNTKGLVELIVLNIGLTKQVINEEIFTIMVIMALVTTFMTTPMVMFLYQPARDVVPYTRRKMDMKDNSDELRLLVCVQGWKQVQPMINLTEILRGKRKRTMRVYMLHLTEFTERSSAIMKIMRFRKEGRPFWSANPDERQHDSVALAFEQYGRGGKVPVRTMVEISGFGDMHEDICESAVSRRANIILLPFHKAGGLDGLLETVSHGIHQVNDRVLKRAPCSVAIMVNRGFGGPNQQLPPWELLHNIAVLFFGGADDREALALAARMAEHQGVGLTVYHFKPATGETVAVPVKTDISDVKSGGSLRRIDSSVFVDTDPDALDEEATQDLAALEALKQGVQPAVIDEAMSPKASEKQGGAENGSHRGSFERGTSFEGTRQQRKAVVVEERVTSDPVAVAIEICKTGEHNLIVIGRGRKPAPMLVPAVESYTQKKRALEIHSDTHQLGLIADALTAEDSELKSSILVVQQFDATLLPLDAKKSMQNIHNKDGSKHSSGPSSSSNTPKHPKETTKDQAAAKDF